MNVLLLNMKLFKFITIIYLFLNCLLNSYNNKEIINENISYILNNYPELKQLTYKANINIPTYNNFIPQGITKVDNYYFITGYYDNLQNSKCYVLNSFGNIVNEIELDTNSHVGSISYDKNRNLLWIPDNNGILNAYNYNDFFKYKKVYALYKIDNISNGLIDYQDANKNLIAYLCIKDNYIYIGNFFINKKCLVKKYYINDDFKLDYINSFKVPNKTQSIDFIKHNNKEYLILSQSYGRNNSSYLYFYEYNSSIKDYNLELMKIKVPPMLEQINVEDNHIHLLFESNASKYNNCLEKIDTIISINIKKLEYKPVFYLICFPQLPQYLSVLSIFFLQFGHIL